MTNTPEAPEAHVHTIQDAENAERQFAIEQTQEDLNALRQQIEV